MRTDFLLGWAQEHFLHGHLLTPWITDYVDLEESLAVGSIAQEELAHASLLMELAGFDTDGRDDIVFSWDADRWSPSGLLTEQYREWPATIVRGLLLSTAAVTRTTWLRDFADDARHAAAAVLLAEQGLHVAHWTRWVHRLGGDPRTSGELAAAMATLLPRAGDLFDAVPADEVTVLRRSWSDETGAVLRAAGVPAVAVVPEPDRQSTSGLASILRDVRAVRTTSDDGVLGRYR